MEWHVNNKIVFFTVWETEKSQIKAPADVVSGEGLLPRSYPLFPTMSSPGGRGKEALLGPLL